MPRNHLRRLLLRTQHIYQVFKDSIYSFFYLLSVFVITVFQLLKLLQVDPQEAERNFPYLLVFIETPLDKLLTNNLTSGILWEFIANLLRQRPDVHSVGLVCLIP